MHDRPAVQASHNDNNKVDLAMTRIIRKNRNVLKIEIWINRNSFDLVDDQVDACRFDKTLSMMIINWQASYQEERIYKIITRARKIHQLLHKKRLFLKKNSKSQNFSNSENKKQLSKSKFF